MTRRFERLSVTLQLLLIGSLAVLPTFLFPYTAAAQTEYKTQLVFEIKTLQNISMSDLAPYFISKDEPTEIPEAQPQIDPNIAILQNYLEQKKSPLAPYAEHILKHGNWKLVLAISNGESTMCKRQLYNNCWGVGGAWNLRRYASFEEGFTDVDRLIATRYVANGLDTPSKIVRRYVGSTSPSWVSAVSQVLAQLDKLPLQN